MLLTRVTRSPAKLRSGRRLDVGPPSMSAGFEKVELLSARGRGTRSMPHSSSAISAKAAGAGSCVDRTGNVLQGPSRRGRLGPRFYITRIAVVGDFNDTPDSNPLKPLLAEGSTLRDIFEHPNFQNDGHPGTFGSATKSNKIDYILLLPELFKVVKRRKCSEKECG
jgi:hypothetical protein